MKDPTLIDGCKCLAYVHTRVYSTTDLEARRADALLPRGVEVGQLHAVAGAGAAHALAARPAA